MKLKCCRGGGIIVFACENGRNRATQAVLPCSLIYLILTLHWRMASTTRSRCASVFFSFITRTMIAWHLSVRSCLTVMVVLVVVKGLSRRLDKWRALPSHHPSIHRPNR